jgi:hypothetical protein
MYRLVGLRIPLSPSQSPPGRSVASPTNVMACVASVCVCVSAGMAAMDVNLERRWNWGESREALPHMVPHCQHRPG